MSPRRPSAPATARADATLMAELLVRAVEDAQGRPGVLVRDVNLDPDAVLEHLQQLRLRDFDLRIAYLNSDAGPSAARAGIPKDVFSTQVEDAERWRNEMGLTALIVVITETDAAKLTSLEEFAVIAPRQLRPLLVERAALQFEAVNDVLPRWWGIIGNDEQISFYDLVDYYLALTPLEPPEAKEQAALQINRLGLLPDPGFFDNPNEAQLRTRLDDNRSLALRLANFSEEDRQKVDKALMEEPDAHRRTELRSQLRDLQNHRRGGELGLTADDARQLLKVRRSQPRGQSGSSSPSGGAATPPPPPPRDLTELAVDGLLQPTNAAEGDETREGITPDVLNNAVNELSGELDKIEDTVRPRPLRVALPSGVEIDEEVKTDVLNLVERMVGEGRYGGLVRVEGDGIELMVRNFQQSADVVRLWEADRARRFLDAFAAASTEFVPAHEAFAAYDAARNDLLPHLRELLVAPLLVTAAPATQALVVRVVDAYEQLISAVTDAYGQLSQTFGQDARAFVEMVMLLDTVFLDNGTSWIALLMPLHPLLLWHYVEYARVISDQRDMLDERDRALVRSEFESGGVPLFLASLSVPRAIGDNAPLSLPYSGRFGGLPQFSDTANARDPNHGMRPLRRLIEAFLAMHPAAAEGLRIALLEPPNAGAVLTLCSDLAEVTSGPSRLRGAHISVLRRSNSLGAELNLSTDEERRVQQRFGDHNDRRFTFETRPVAPTTLAPPADLNAHIFVAFDQSPRHSATAGGQPQTIQPLANRRRLSYSIDTEKLDLVPQSGGILASYYSLTALAGGEGVSYPTIHQEHELQERFREGLRDVPWYVVVDGHVDRDLDLGGLRVLTDREGTRDVAAFTRSPDAFRRSLRDVVRQFNTYVTDEALDVLLATLSELLDAGLLALRPGRSGEIVEAHVKGMLGLMVAVQYLRASVPDGHERVILSLDDDQARRWLHLNETGDRSRSDLLVIDGADDRFTVTIVEVKTRQDATPEYTLSNGEIAGPAINQLLSTHRLLRRVFDPDSPDLLLTPSRREIIREHLYRELSKRSYDSDARQRWTALSRKLFDEGADVDLRCALVDVQLGVAASSLEPSRDVQAIDADHLIKVSLRHLNEAGVPGLEEALTPPDDPDGHGNRSAEPTGETRAEEADGTSQAVEPQGPTERPSAGSEPRARVLLGTAPGTYGADRDVWFDPQQPDQPLSNPHISISGETGSGKTQATKAILHDFLPQGLPALILDFKDDYSKSDYATAEGFVVHDASLGSLPFNPMIPPVDPESGRANPTSHIHSLAGMLQRIYKLGDQQAYQLREAMKETYAINGIGTRPFVPADGQQYLPFDAVRDVLVREEAHTLLGRLSPVFDLGLFSEGDAATTLNELLSEPTVIRLSQLPGDQVKNAVAEFFLMALYTFLIRRQHPHRLERLLVLDEAWRLVDSPFLEPLMREGRAFGLGVIIATQFPKDLPEAIAGSTATRLFFGQTKAEQVREIQKTLVGKTSGQEADHLGNLIRGLAPLECVMQNIHYRPWIKVKTVPYYARLAAPEVD